jgi:hypothetical protein
VEEVNFFGRWRVTSFFASRYGAPQKRKYLQLPKKLTSSTAMAISARRFAIPHTLEFFFKQWIS